MKRTILCVLVLLLISMLVACTPTELAPPEGTDTIDDEATLTAKIIDIDGQSILLANIAKDAGKADIYRIDSKGLDVINGDGAKVDSKTLEKGMIVDIAFDGTILESFPMGLSGIKDIHIKGLGDDIAGLYRTVIEDLYQVDPGLNSNISILAFDLTGISNMTEAEKTALIYLIGETYGMETIAGTFDELSEQDYIDKEQLYFEKGLLFTLEDEPMSDDIFPFNATKWRSGLGAYSFADCRATKSKDGWSYEIGSEMIS